jgi:hypothetical protein
MLDSTFIYIIIGMLIPVLQRIFSVENLLAFIALFHTNVSSGESQLTFTLGDVSVGRNRHNTDYSCSNFLKVKQSIAEFINKNPSSYIPSAARVYPSWTPRFIAQMLDNLLDIKISSNNFNMNVILNFPSDGIHNGNVNEYVSVTGFPNSYWYTHTGDDGVTFAVHLQYSINEKVEGKFHKSSEVITINADIPIEKLMQFFREKILYPYIVSTYKAPVFEHKYLVMIKPESESSDYIMFDKYKLNIKTENLCNEHWALVKHHIDALAAGKLQKLTMMFTGRPGCGKTSFIKGIVSYTKRHVLSVNLGAIKTCQQLMNLFFAEEISTNDDDDIEVPLNERIYLLEDVDADTKLFNRRAESYESDEEDIVASSGINASDVVSGLVDKIMEHKKSSKERADGGNDSDSDSDEEKINGVINGSANGGANGSANGSANRRTAASHYTFKENAASLFAKKPDQITLSNVLNLLDGVFEINGPIIILSTNHPEKLDPALIRPGRVDLCLTFSKMRREDIYSFATKFYKLCDNKKTREQRMKIIPDRAYTLAVVSAVCRELDSASDFFAACSSRTIFDKYAAIA